jgi:Prokaryotic Cytochrome C oxidase subunit IV
MNALVPLLRTRTTAVWLMLIGATILSWTLGVDHSLGLPGGHWSTAIVILLIALVKVRFVGLDFMELRGAPPALRAVFETYCAAVLLALSAIYLLS